MKIGVMTHATDLTIDPARLAVEVEQRGFSSLFLTEHTHIPVRPFIRWWGGQPMPEEYKRLHDPIVALSTAAAVTTRIRLGTGVLVLAQREPLATAKQLASLDRLSGGRHRTRRSPDRRRSRSRRRRRGRPRRRAPPARPSRPSSSERTGSSVPASSRPKSDASAARPVGEATRAAIGFHPEGQDLLYRCCTARGSRRQRPSPDSRKGPLSRFSTWWRGQDLNLRPSGIVTFRWTDLVGSVRVP
jgi:hypothetical protein